MPKFLNINPVINKHWDGDWLLVIPYKQSKQLTLLKIPTLSAEISLFFTQKSSNYIIVRLQKANFCNKMLLVIWNKSEGNSIACRDPLISFFIIKILFAINDDNQLWNNTHTTGISFYLFLFFKFYFGRCILFRELKLTANVHHT